MLVLDRARGRNSSSQDRPTGEVDHATLQRAKGGDQEACAAVVETYERPVFALLGRMLTPRGLGSTVEDLAQECFFRAFAALPRFDAEGAAKLSTWLLCIASRLAINEINRKRSPIALVDQTPVAQETADAEHHRNELRHAIQQAINALTAEQQAVFVMREYHGLNYDEIAEALGLSIPTVKSRLYHARKSLRTALHEVQHG